MADPSVVTMVVRSDETMDNCLVGRLVGPMADSTVVSMVGRSAASMAAMKVHRMAGPSADHWAVLTVVLLVSSTVERLAASTAGCSVC